MQQETKNNLEMQSLIQPVKRKKMDNQSKLAEYKEVFKELSVHNDMIVLGHKIVVPPTLKDKHWHWHMMVIKEL